MKKILLVVVLFSFLQTIQAQLTIYSSYNSGGISATCIARTIYKGNGIPNGLNNSIKSISLSQGFMATVAENEDGTGERFTYMATQSAITVNLAMVLQNKISFIRVLKLPHTPVRKKGAGVITNADEIAANVTWFYDWGIRDTTTDTREFVPMAWGSGGAADLRVDSVINKDSLTHYLAFNEPNHAGQSNMFVNRALPLYKNLLRAGYRMGSPVGTEEAYATWVDSFTTEANKQKLQIDFVCVHWYDWGNWLSTLNANPTATQVLNRFKAYIDNVWNLYKKPIWITEFNANVNRSAAVNQAFFELAIPWMDSDPRIERYAPFFEDHFPLRDENGNLTPMGTMYNAQTSALVHPQNVIDTRPAFPETVLAGFNTSTLNTSTSNSIASSLAPTTLDSRITATQPLTAASGITGPFSLAGYWGGLSWSNSTASVAISDNKFLSFKLQAASGKTVSYTLIDEVNIRVNTNGPNQFQFQYQINNGSFVNIATRSIPTVTSLTTATLSQIDLSGITALQNIPSTSTVTFRLIPFGATTTNSFAIGNGTSNADNDIAVKGYFSEDSTSLFTAPGNALSFDGTNDAVTISSPTNLDLVTDYTLEAWIKPTNFAAGAGIISKSHSNGSNGYFLTLANNAPFTGINFDGLETSTKLLEAGKWYHIAAVKNGSTRTLYINGVAISLSGTAITTATTTDWLRIGLHQLFSPKYFAGSIDEVKIWNVARTEAEIKANMFATLSPNLNNLVCYYNFDNGKPGASNTGLTTLVNQTNTSNVGTLNNFALTGATSNWVESYSMIVPTIKPETNKTGNSFTANWDAPALISLQNVSNYLLDVSTSGDFSSFISGYSSLSVSGTSQQVTGLTPNTTYYYRVRANKTSVANEGGFSATDTVIPFSNDADLIALSLSSGSISPAFSSNITAYTVSYANNISSITVTSTKDFVNATIQISINGGAYTTVNSGTASGSLSLIVGTNTINVLVTAEDLVTTKLYVITATRLVNTWTGASTANYNTAANWSGGVVPTINDDVLIPDVSGTSNRFPQITGDNQAQWLSFAKNVTINVGASLTVTNNSGFTRYGIFRVAGNITNNGTLNVISRTIIDANGATIEFAGTTPQTIAANTFAGNSVYNLTINNDAGVTLDGSLTVNGNLVITNGNFNTNNNLTLSSISTRTARVGASNGTVTGNVTVERFLPARRAWRLLTAPVTQSTPSSLNTTWKTQVDIVGPSGSNLSSIRPGYNFFTYNGNSNAWVSISNPALVNLTGSSLNNAFCAFIAGPNGTNLPNSANVTLRSTGELLMGTKTFSSSVATNNFILIPNPYASTVGLEEVFAASSGITNTIYTWDPRLGGGSGTGGYITIQRNGVNNFTITGGSTGQKEFIQSGQAFFVQANSSTQNVVFNEAAKSRRDSVVVFGAGTGNTDQLRIGLNKFESSTSVVISEIVAQYNNNFNKAVSFNEDAEKMWNNEENISLRRDGYHLSIENRPFIGANNDSIFIALSSLIPNVNYALELKPSNWDAGSKAYLIDNVLNTETLIDLNSPNFLHQFTSNTATLDDRFVIVFRNSTLPNKNFNMYAEKFGNNKVRINWEAQSETAVKEYILEKSEDGINYQAISTQSAKNGNITNAYNYTDNSPVNGVNYYRVKTIQQNDIERYSKVVLVNFKPQILNVLNVFPNPVKGNTIGLQLQNIEKGTYSIRILTVEGKEMHKQQLQITNSNINTYITPQSKLKNGSYTLQLINSKNNYSTKIVVE
ncbi:MAG: glycosyl hydrolase [Chitinophagaceae bacterium]